MSDVRAIAYYLPQFHPIPENDLWWGKGFTEWRNVARARPFFLGHEQPQLPADLGFYDLRLPEVREAQADLARQYGIHGFCYYYYWFNGKRLLERPLDEVVRGGQPDFPFCICWANENWTRRWDGAEHEILMAQEHTAETDRRFIADVLPILRDPRYVTVRGAPLLLIYRPGLLPEPRRTTETWREAASQTGLPGLHLCAVQSFGFEDPSEAGFDSAVEFPPHGFAPDDIRSMVQGLAPEFRGTISDYGHAARAVLGKPPVPYRRFRTVMAGWDNTARRGANGHVFANATPSAYESWLRAVVAETEATHAPEERLVFINAWNEWAEGAHLEPDLRHGHGWLEATARALRLRSPAPEVGARAAPPDLTAAEEARLERVRGRLFHRHRLQVGGSAHLETVDGGPAGPIIRLRRGMRYALGGWAVAPGVEFAGLDASAWLVLLSTDRRRLYRAPIASKTRRPDVAGFLPSVDPRLTARAGFYVAVACERLPRGEWNLGVVHAFGGQEFAAFCQTRVVTE